MSIDLVHYSIEDACKITGLSRDELFEQLSFFTAEDAEQGGLPVKITREQARKLYDAGDFTISFPDDDIERFKEASQDG